MSGHLVCPKKKLAAMMNAGAFAARHRQQRYPYVIKLGTYTKSGVKS
jgi:hypothetical protein